MQTITGNKYIYYRSGNVLLKETYSINIGYNDRVKFVDNSYLDDCWTNRINTEDNDESIMLAACEDNNNTTYQGRVIKIDSKQIANAFFYKTEEIDKVIEMPIAVMIDNTNRIIYCNPLNIVKV